MVGEIVFGTDIQVYMDGTLVACAQSVSVKSSRKVIPILCAGSGDTEKKRLGKMSHTFQIQGLWRYSTGADVATNVTTKEFWDKYLAGADVDIELKSESPIDGEVTYLGTGAFNDMGMDAQVDEVGKMDVSGYFNTFEPVVLDVP